MIFYGNFNLLNFISRIFSTMQLHKIIAIRIQTERTPEPTLQERHKLPPPHGNFSAREKNVFQSVHPIFESSGNQSSFGRDLSKQFRESSFNSKSLNIKDCFFQTKHLNFSQTQLQKKFELEKKHRKRKPCFSLYITFRKIGFPEVVILLQIRFFINKILNFKLFPMI